MSGKSPICIPEIQAYTASTMTSADLAAMRIALRILNATAANKVPDDNDVIALRWFAPSLHASPADELARGIIEDTETY